MLFRTSDGCTLKLNGMFFSDQDFEFRAIELLPGVYWPYDSIDGFVPGSFGEQEDGEWIPWTLCFETADKVFLFCMSVDDDGCLQWLDTDSDAFVCHGVPDVFLRNTTFRGRFAWLSITHHRDNLIYLTEVNT